MKPLLQREWLLTRWPLAGALVAQLTFLLVQAPRRYETVRESVPSILGLLLAAWLGYHRVYAEQARGTWLLQPFSRTQLVLAKVLHASAALLLFALMESLSRYAWVCTAAAPGGPIPSLPRYLLESLSVQLGATHAILFATSIAALAERRWVQGIGVAAGLGWLFVATLDGHQLDALVGFVPLRSPRAWHVLALSVIAMLGLGTLVRTAREVGHPQTTATRIASALWRTPVAILGILVASEFAPESQPRLEFDDTVLLRDGEIVSAHFDQHGGHAVRLDGRDVRLPRRPSDTPDERVQLRNRLRDVLPWGAGLESPVGSAFLAEDGRTLLIFGQTDEGDPRVACWGRDGLREGTLDCAPGAQILATTQLRRGATQVDGLLIVTQEGVHLLNAQGAQTRFRGTNIEGAALLGEAEDVLAVFTEDALVILGAIERRCPHASRDARIGLLEDNTVAALDHGVLTYCREAENTRVAWPVSAENPLPWSLRASLLLPLGWSPYIATSTWALALLWRLLGIALLIALDRKRGFVISLPGIVLGPAYSLAAALVFVRRMRLPTRAKRHAALRNGGHLEPSE